MSTTIKLNRSDTPGSLPTAVDGELSVQRADKRILMANSTVVFDAFQNTVSNIAISNSAGYFKIGNSTVNVVVNSTSISLANSTVTFALTLPTAADYASATKFLSANGSYLTPAGSPGGANQTVQYNNSGSFAGNTNFSYNPANSTLSLAGTFTANGDTIAIGNSTVNVVVNSIAAVFGVNATINSTVFTVGNSTVNSVVNSTGLGIQSVGVVFHNGTASVCNVGQVQVGSNVLITNVAALFGNSTVNATANSIAFTLANSTVTYSLIKPTAAQVTAGNYYSGADGTWRQASGSVAGSNTFIQFNDSAAFGAVANLVYDKTANKLTIGNSTINVAVNSIAAVFGGNAIVNSTVFTVGNSTINATYNSVGFSLNGGTTVVNNSVFFAGNSTVNAIGNSTVEQFATATITTVYGAPSANIGANVSLTTVQLSIGNTTVNSIANSLGFSLNGGTTVVNNSVFFAGNSTVNAVGNSTVDQFRTATVTTTYQATSAAIGANVTLSTTGLLIGNSTVNATVNSLSIVFANSTVTYQPVSAYAQTAFTQQQYFSLATLTDAATVNWAVNTAQKAKVTLGGNRTMAAVTGAQEGATYLLWVLQDATGSRTLSWTTSGAGSFDFGTAGAPTLTTTASQGDLLSFEAITIASTLKLRFAGIAKGFA